jgi:hypothetical protein
MNEVALDFIFFAPVACFAIGCFTGAAIAGDFYKDPDCIWRRIFEVSRQLFGRRH